MGDPYGASKVSADSPNLHSNSRDAECRNINCKYTFGYINQEKGLLALSKGVMVILLPMFLRKR
ncbi:hypothetical protein HanHA300_Chr04g0137651 [Helianthus annuus]|nr:hypothetical protein HanHA300_Chr04g0137651 [Helianthus annuus]KAJ0597095.1 hypothetical protein HanHA89_Chr04g0150601 [Helianthus annuus]KAJ0757773.1 hypothetical protein HanLR1_Chr04g0142671 [Helianthus annuus]KAJ0761449.1 hypothetical protein HanOQP8_Chr04g0149991 [Helianthus annuus]